ncbi:PepSY-associated TM helix domain-containing protein [Dawidia soli]|uniref:PepSY domain-containing protein n=1 Tax=Dawidia soli TaxID=2782352 RepID=A0AAP2GJE4_9BACT|nr:PepSY-associated TM helix domain-containing protein [Dawidia soli]MBT1689316.1 PepSY domain-containing protein [Dawidia soli]
MDNRNYNIYFHTHTISGIIICALLYVMFFAGSFSFFKDDISAWQKNESITAQRGVTERDFNHVLDSLAANHTLKGRDIEFSMQRHGMGAYVSMSASHDSTVKAKVKKKPEEQKKRRGRGRRGGNDDSAFFTYNFGQQREVDYQAGYDMGEFLYRLHFLAQLNVVPIYVGAPFGYLLAGIVSFLFLFALITGLMLHWDKIVSNFFTFRPWAKWKTVWTDLHTGLGVIQFPFQFIFAVTGIVLIANTFLMTPYATYLYKGDSEKLYKALEYSDSSEFEYTYKRLAETFDLNAYLAGVEQRIKGGEISRVSIKNYQDDNMHVIVLSKPLADASFAGSGKTIYRVRDRKVLSETLPAEHASYIDNVKALIYHLHFGDFGGRPLRVMYFVLGAMGCVVIISGILIWLVARDKNSVPKHKRVFNFWTANVFMAACMSMLPVTAFTMIVLLFLKDPGQADIYHWYFYSWLVLGVYFIVRKDLAITNRQTTLLSAATCFLLPLLDGIVRDNWFWNTYARRAYDILFIDLLFLTLAVISVVVWVKVRKAQAAQEVETTVQEKKEKARIRDVEVPTPTHN